MNPLIIILIVLVLFFFLWMGPRNQRKRQAQLASNLTTGAEVRTIGGILGTVVETLDDSVIIETTEGVRLRMLKTAIAGAVAPSDPFAGGADSAAVDEQEPEAETEHDEPSDVTEENASEERSDSGDAAEGERETGHTAEKDGAEGDTEAASDASLSGHEVTADKR